MNKFIAFLTCIFVSGMALAQEAAVREKDVPVKEVLEPIRVISIEQQGNLMPGPGRNTKTVTTVIKFEALSDGTATSEDFNVEVSKSGEFQVLKFSRKNMGDLIVARLKTFEVKLTNVAYCPQVYPLTNLNQVIIANPVYMTDHTSH